KSGPLSGFQLTDSGGTAEPSSVATTDPAWQNVKISVSDIGLDKEETLIVRDSVQGTENRTGAVECGWGPGASGLGNAIQNGCTWPVKINQRLTPPNLTLPDACTPEPLTAAQDPQHVGYYDCVGDQRSVGNTTSVGSDLAARFPCTANNWTNDPNWKPSSNDPRLAYIYLTTYGMLNGNGYGSWVPVTGFIAFYVTGWQTKQGGNRRSCAFDEKPPTPFDDKGSQVWGHYVDYIDLTPNTDPSGDPCNLDASVLLCKPTLVR